MSRYLRKRSSINLNAFPVIFLYFVVNVNGWAVTFTSHQDPYCDSDRSVTWRPQPYYKCYNYTTFPENLAKAEKIKSLDFADKGNAINLLKHGALIRTKASNLDRLYLDKCQIQEIEMGAFQGGSKVSELWLRFNKIEELNPSVFSDLWMLRFLWLRGNPLKGFSERDEFPRINLIYLDLGQCDIQSISPNLLRNLERLETLLLDKNKLTTLDWKVIKPLKSLKSLELHENPFHCDCQIRFILDYLDKRNIEWILTKGDSPTCKSSPSSNLTQFQNDKLAGVKWNEVNRDLFTCLPLINSLEAVRNGAGVISGQSPIKPTLQCDYSGYPQPIIKWTKDGKDLDRKYTEILVKVLENSEESSFHYKFRQTLVFHHKSLNFEGTYECQVSNIDGNDSKVYSLYVLEPSTRTSDQAVVTEDPEITAKTSVAEISTSIVTKIMSSTHLPMTMTSLKLTTEAIKLKPTTNEMISFVENHVTPAAIGEGSGQGSDLKLLYFGVAFGALVVLAFVLALAVIYLYRSKKNNEITSEFYQMLPRPNSTTESRVTSRVISLQKELESESEYTFLGTDEGFYEVPLPKPPPLPSRPPPGEQRYV